MRVLARLLVLLVALMVAAPAASAEFGAETERGWPVNVHGEEVVPPVDPVEVLIAPPLNKAGPFTLFPYYPLLVAELQRLVLDHPDKVRLHSAGKSTLQLDLWYLEIADFDRIDAGEGRPLHGREVVYIDGGTHSNEYSGVYFVTELAQFLLDEYGTNETAKWIVENRHTYILPMVNPDGSNVFGRLNAKTVNVNRNFPGTWGAVDEDPVLNNPGPAAASEPETQAVLALLDEIRPDYVNSIHCCGNLWLHPYGAEHLGDAPDLEMFTRICDEVFADVRDDCGPIWSTIYPASGTTADEGYVRLGASSWTYEMSGRGKIVGPWGEPAVNTDVRYQERESWQGIMHALMNVEKYGALPSIGAITGTADALDITLTNVGWGRLMSGNLSIGASTARIPELAPGEAATVRMDGAFMEGTTGLLVDWQKRVWRAPQEERTFALRLFDTGSGLAGLMADGDAGGSTQRVSSSESVPSLAPLVVLTLLGAAVFVARRRR